MDEVSDTFPGQVQLEFIVKEVHTDLVITVYADRVFIIITQIDKFGTLINAWSEPKADGGKLFMVETMMGKRDDPLLNIYARQIIERISMSSDKPLLLAISIKDECRDTETFQIILNKLYENFNF